MGNGEPFTGGHRCIETAKQIGLTIPPNVLEGRIGHKMILDFRLPIFD
jgi:hypothetical protein